MADNSSETSGSGRFENEGRRRDAYVRDRDRGAEELHLEDREEGFTARIQSVGGSLKVLLQIAVLAWGVRQLRSVLARRRASQQASTVPGSSAPAFAILSPAAAYMLVELQPTQFTIIDVRSATTGELVPAPLAGAVLIPERELQMALQSSGEEWAVQHKLSSQPLRRELLLVVSRRGRRARRAAATIATLGFSRCCVLDGGLLAYESFLNRPPPPPLQMVSRDALALWLERAQQQQQLQQQQPAPGSPSPVPIPIVMDLRRHDERSLYGAIPSSVHLPVEHLPRALAMDAAAWEQQLHLRKPAPDDWLVLCSRGCRRALWAAQLIRDAGLTRALVYAQGAAGWRLDPAVMSYPAFQEGDPPPPPLPFDVDFIDEGAAEDELRVLGIL